MNTAPNLVVSIVSAAPATVSHIVWTGSFSLHSAAISFGNFSSFFFVSFHHLCWRPNVRQSQLFSAKSESFLAIFHYLKLRHRQCLLDYFTNFSVYYVGVKCAILFCFVLFLCVNLLCLAIVYRDIILLSALCYSRTSFSFTFGLLMLFSTGIARHTLFGRIFTIFFPFIHVCILLFIWLLGIGWMRTTRKKRSDARRNFNWVTHYKKCQAMCTSTQMHTRLFNTITVNLCSSN